MSRFAWSVCVAVGLTVGSASAEEEKFPTVFAFSQQAVDGNLPDEELVKAGGTVRLRPRANTTTVYHVYMQNPTKTDGTFVVEVGGGAVATATVENVEAGKWRRVKFAVPAAVPAPAVPPPAPGVAAPAPTPAGKALAPTDGGFPLSFRLLDANKKPIAKTERVTELKAAVAIDDPIGYVAAKERLAYEQRKEAEVTLGFDWLDPKKPGVVPAALRLTFPPSGNDPKLKTRDGVYARTLKTDGSSITLSGAAGGYGLSLLAHVSVDGVERAFIYRVTPSESGEKQFEKIDTVASRVYPVAGWTTAAATKPVAAFQVRVEADNAKPDDTLSLHLRRKGDTAAETEVVTLGGPREEQVWVEAGEPKSQGLSFFARSRDWVRAVDLTDARGQLLLTPVLEGKDGKKVGTPLTVVVDDTPPEVTAVRFTNLTNGDKQLFKGQPLRVSATIRDSDTGVAKAVFLFGAPGEDGKPAPDAVKVPGTRAPVDPKDALDPRSSVWTAALPLPADRTKELALWVSATDDAGNTGLSEPKRIELVDAPPPGAKPGKIQGKIVFGDRPQPGMTVVLEADGKPKGSAKSNDKGQFVFEKVPPGTYKVVTGKTDFSTGLSGAADVTVEPDATAKPTITLSKNKPK